MRKMLARHRAATRAELRPFSTNNELLIENPAATFAVRIAGESVTLSPGSCCLIGSDALAIGQRATLLVGVNLGPHSPVDVAIRNLVAPSALTRPSRS